LSDIKDGGEKMRMIDADALETYTATCPEGDDPTSFMDGIQDVLEHIDAMATIPVAPVRYAYLKKSGLFSGRGECSLCGIMYPYPRGSHTVLNYCSKCGAMFLEGKEV
jgi:hypothetical protein